MNNLENAAINECQEFHMAIESLEENLKYISSLPKNKRNGNVVEAESALKKAIDSLKNSRLLEIEKWEQI